MTDLPSVGLPPAQAARLAAIELATRFTLDARGAILTESPPDLSPGPLLHVAAAEPRVIAFGHSLSEDIQGQLAGILAQTVDPVLQVAECLEAMSALGSVILSEGLSFLLLPQSPAPCPANLVRWGTPEGSALEARFAAAGMPASLADQGFRSVADLWPPWCAAIVEGEVASLAFSSRLTPSGAELGLITLPGYRGNGLAGAATAGWSALPALQGRTLFYSTARSNLASQRVAAKLRLPFICSTWEIARA